MRLIMFIVERAVIVRILQHLGESSEPPRAGPTATRRRPRKRGPRGLVTSMLLHSNPTPNTQHMPDYDNQRQDLDW